MIPHAARAAMMVEFLPPEVCDFPEFAFGADAD